MKIVMRGADWGASVYGDLCATRENGGVNPPLRKVQGPSWTACRVGDATDQSTGVGWPCESRSGHGPDDEPRRRPKDVHLRAPRCQTSHDAIGRQLCRSAGLDARGQQAYGFAQK